MQALIISNLCVHVCVKCFVWLRKAECKTEYICSKQSNKILTRKIFIVKKISLTTQEDAAILPTISNGEFPKLWYLFS